MVKQRETFKRFISPEAEKRIRDRECPNCGLPKADWKRRTDWTCCSKKCSEEFYASYKTLTWPELRLEAFQRDNHTCQMCGKGPIIAEGLIGDHINPIAMGGEEWDLDNVQTLCIACDKKKTKADAGNIAKLRRVEKFEEIREQKRLFPDYVELTMQRELEGC